MNLYPALQADMGTWKYYIVKMRMREVAAEVRFANEVYEDRTLDDAIQRELNEGRVKREIISFLSRRRDRFFSSLVVAAIGGSPKFYAVTITDDPQFKFFADQGIDQAFGVLTFSGDQQYYALDGQHRLKAIKALLDPRDPASRTCPPGFENEQISVIVVVKRDEPLNEFLKSYRRLFSSLNRYAKATDLDTNIIMDEDDTFAILTRRLISEHAFFKWVRNEESPRVKTKGKNLRSADPQFTSLQTLYYMNEQLLSAAWRLNSGFGPAGETERDVKLFKRFRPSSEEYLDALYDELALYWDSLLEVLPSLEADATKKRAHNADEDASLGLQDDLLFWPIGQELLSEVARSLLDKRQREEDVRTPTSASATAALRPLSLVDWNLHRPPWRNFLLTGEPNTWKMRSEDRSAAVDLGKEMVRWILAVDDLGPEDLEDLRRRWQASLLPGQTPERAEEMWGEVKAQRAKIEREAL